jgi:NarL family two-component system response regulator YdfI
MEPLSKIWIMAPTAARRDWLDQSVRRDPRIQVIGTAATLPFLRSLITQTSADVAVIDLEGHIESSLVRDWLFEFVDLVPLLLLTSAPDATIFNRVLDEKVGGFLRADASADQITQAIRSLTSGLMIMDGALLHRLVRGADEGLPLPEALTSREMEVFGLLSDGLGNKQIASRLNISEHTIKFHVRSILGKLGASTRTEAVSRGLRGRLIDL